MLIRHKRAFLAHSLRWTGLLPLLERVARRPGLVVLCYHRIGEPGGRPINGSFVSASPEALREQIRLIRDRFRVLTLEDVAERFGEDGAAGADERSILITFDDGYRDQLDLALPVLVEWGIPAAFFLATDFLDGSRLPWWDHVGVVVRQCVRRRLVLDHPEPMDLDLDTMGRDAASAAIIAACCRVNRLDDRAVLAHLEERAGHDGARAASGRDLLMDWDDARGLIAAGMSIGSHTVSHRRLADWTEAEQTDELVESRRRLERELGRTIAAIAYPYGDARAFDATTRSLARDAGYRLGLALRPGVLRTAGADPFDIPRFNVIADDSPTLVRARLAVASAWGSSPL